MVFLEDCVPLLEPLHELTEEMSGEQYAKSSIDYSDSSSSSMSNSSQDLSSSYWDGKDYERLSSWRSFEKNYTLQDR